MLLATHPEVTSLGELQLLPHLLREPEARCQCGETLGTCPMWGPIVNRCENRAAIGALTRFRESKDAGRVIRWRWLPDLLTGRAGSRAREEAPRYAAVTVEALARAGQVHGARLVVDTSKDPYRLHLLRVASRLGSTRAGSMDVRVVHLVRDPRGFVASTVGATRVERRSERAPASSPSFLRVARVAARWLVQQLLFERLRAGDPPALLVRYEDLASDPHTELERIAAWLGVDASGFDPPAFRAAPGHALGGNPMRHRSDPIALDERWRSDLRPAQATLTWWICAPLARRYGYGRSAPPAART